MTSEVDLGALRVDGDYFLTAADPVAVPYTPHDRSNHTYRHLAAYRDSEQTIQRELITRLRTAERKIFIAGTSTDDPAIAAELVAAAERLHGSVYVISPLDDPAEQSTGPHRDNTGGHKHFEGLVSKGIYVRGHDGCQANFAVIDDKTAFIVNADFISHGSEISVNGTVIDDPVEAGRLARLFARLWHQECTWEIPPISHGERYTIGRRKPHTWNNLVPPLDSDGRPGVIWTNGKEQLILRHITNIVAAAQHELLLATGSLNGMREKRDLLLAPITHAVIQGVRVKLLVQATNEPPQQRAEAGAFADVGVEIIPDTVNRAKYAIADRRHGVLFSANLDTHGLTSGIDVGARLDDTPALTQAISYIEHTMAHADAEFVRQPTQRELHDRLIGLHQHRWPLQTHITAQAHPDDWAQFIAAAQHGPVLFTILDGTIKILADKRHWSLTQSPNEDSPRLTLLRDSTGMNPARKQFEDWLQAAGHGNELPGGLCPAKLSLARR